ncbi:MAG: hypothetical protein WD020_04450, partial [Acidimicrobiia bacterium]
LRAWLERRASLAELTGTAVRVPVTVHTVSLLADAGWVIGAYLVAMVVTVVRVGLEAAWGAPDVGGLVAALAAVIACAAVGWAAGWWLPSRLTGPLTGVGLYVAMGVVISIGNNNAGIGPLVPSAAPTRLRPMETVGEWMGWLQFGWFAGLTVVLVGLTVLAVTRRSGMALVGFGVILAVGFAGVLLGRDHERRLDPTAPVTCLEADGIEVCTHPAYGDAIGPMAEAVAATVRPLVDAGVVPRKVMDRGYAPPQATFAFFPHPDEAVVADGVARDLVHRGRCWDVAVEVDRAADFLSRWLVVQAGYMPVQSIHPAPETPEAFHHDSQREAFDRFSRLDPGGQVAWLAENFDDVAGCRVEIGDIP